MKLLSRTSPFKALPLAVIASGIFASNALAANDPSAGGAAIRDVIIASAIVSFAMSALVILVLAYRNGRVGWLYPAAEYIGDRARLAPWAAFPAGLLGASLLLAVAGFYWDVAIHASIGRDDGPLANPSHYLILIGMVGMFWSGVLAMALPKPGTKPTDTAVRISDNWYAPVGGVLITISALFSLIGFPLDDVWHRLFGQDVTLWSPTHLLMLGGGMLALIGEAVLLVEGRKAYEAPEAGSPRLRSWDPPASWDAMNNKIRRTMLGGGILVGLCIFQAEFDYGIPQFRMIFSPMLLMMSASIALVFIRIFAGRFGAIGAVLFYALIRLGLLIFVDPIMGDLASTFPVFWVEAIVVEVAALIVSTKKPVQFAAVAGALIGTFGLAFEYGWSHVFAAYHWDADLFPLAAILGFIAAMAGAQIGAWMGNSLRQRPPIEGAGRHLAAGSFAVILMLIAFGLHEQPVTGLTASVTTTPAKVNKPGRWVNATVKLSDPQATKDAIWIKQIAWQGKPGLETATMREVSPGVLQTTRPMPVSGSWKSGIRIQKGSSVMGMALYYPRDDAIPVAEIPALAAFERGFQPDRQLLQRENKIDGGPLAIASYALLFFLAMLLIGLQAWGIARVGTGRPPTSDEVDGHRAEVRSSRSTTRPSPA